MEQLNRRSDYDTQRQTDKQRERETDSLINFVYDPALSQGQKQIETMCGLTKGQILLNHKYQITSCPKYAI